MLLTISTTHTPATDLGYLLHKNPSRAQSFDRTFGPAHVFYPEADAQRCTAALLLDVDAVHLCAAAKDRAVIRACSPNTSTTAPTSPPRF